MQQFLVRTALTAFTLWIATLIVPGLDFVGGDETWEKIGIVLVVAVIFGVVNAVIKPVVQLFAIPLYILTIGLIHIVINALMLELTAWITRNTTHWGLEVDSFFWAAILGAVVVSIVGWLLDLTLKEDPGAGPTARVGFVRINLRSPMTKRPLILLSIPLVAAGVLAGCGDDSSPATSRAR